MKELCFGLAIGTILGVLVVTSSQTIEKKVKEVTNKVSKKANEIKNKLTNNEEE